MTYSLNARQLAFRNADEYEYPVFLEAAFIIAEHDGIDPVAVKRAFNDMYENLLKKQLGYDE